MVKETQSSKLLLWVATMFPFLLWLSKTNNYNCQINLQVHKSTLWLRPFFNFKIKRIPLILKTIHLIWNFKLSFNAKIRIIFSLSKRNFRSSKIVVPLGWWNCRVFSNNLWGFISFMSTFLFLWQVVLWSVLKMRMMRIF